MLDRVKQKVTIYPYPTTHTEKTACHSDCTMAYAIIHHPVQSQARSCGICGIQSGTGKGSNTPYTAVSTKFMWYTISTQHNSCGTKFLYSYTQYKGCVPKMLEQTSNFLHLNNEKPYMSANSFRSTAPHICWTSILQIFIFRNLKILLYSVPVEN